MRFDLRARRQDRRRPSRAAPRSRSANMRVEQAPAQSRLPARRSRLEPVQHKKCMQASSSKRPSSVSGTPQPVIESRLARLLDDRGYRAASAAGTAFTATMEGGKHARYCPLAAAIPAADIDSRSLRQLHLRRQMAYPPRLVNRPDRARMPRFAVRACSSAAAAARDRHARAGRAARSRSTSAATCRRSRALDRDPARHHRPRTTVTRLLGLAVEHRALRRQHLVLHQPEEQDRGLLQARPARSAGRRHRLRQGRAWCSEVRHRGMQDAQAVTPNPNATPAPGREFSLHRAAASAISASSQRQGPGAGRWRRRRRRRGQRRPQRLPVKRLAPPSARAPEAVLSSQLSPATPGSPAAAAPRCW